MAFPRKLLSPGEEVVLEAHPNWSILVPRVALFLVIVAGCLSIVAAWTHAPLWVGWVLLGVAAAFLLGLLAKIVVWRSTTLVLTTVRVVYRTGALRRLGREIPLDRVQNVTYRQSIVERLVGAGSLTIESAGMHGDDPFPDIRHPASVQSLINRLITHSGGGLGGRGGGAGYVQQPHPQPEPQSQPQYAPQPPPVPPARYQPPQYQPPQYQPPQYTPPPQHQGSQPRNHESQPRNQETQPPQGPREQFEPARDPTAVPATAPPLAVSPSERLRHLSELHRLGVITDAEYAQMCEETPPH
jgi:membrane protein YdbS with pleckstrin-like domain